MMRFMSNQTIVLNICLTRQCPRTGRDTRGSSRFFQRVAPGGASPRRAAGAKERRARRGETRRQDPGRSTRMSDWVRIRVTYAHMRRSLLVLLLGGVAIYPVHGAGNVDAAFKTFWDAPNPSAAEKAAHTVVGSGVSFGDAWTRLKAGRSYATEKTGLIRHPASVGGVTIDNIIEVRSEER